MKRCLPFGRNPAFAFQPVEGRVERAVLDLQQVFRGSLDVLRNLAAMRGTEEQGAEDEHIQGFLDGRRPTENLASDAGYSPLLAEQAYDESCGAIIYAISICC
jgi:hypothetical protein